MRRSSLGMIVLLAMVAGGGCAWFPPWSDRHSAIVDSASIPMQDAVRTAEASIPGGKAIEAELTKEGDRVVYEVDVLDNTKSSRTVYVDAKNGMIVRAER